MLSIHWTRALGLGDSCPGEVPRADQPTEESTEKTFVPCATEAALHLRAATDPFRRRLLSGAPPFRNERRAGTARARARRLVGLHDFGRSS